MSTAYHCDGPDCDTWARGGMAVDFLIVRDWEERFDFCSWDCLLKFAAGKPPMRVLP